MQNLLDRRGIRRENSIAFFNDLPDFTYRKVEFICKKGFGLIMDKGLLKRLRKMNFAQKLTLVSLISLLLTSTEIHLMNSQTFPKIGMHLVTVSDFLTLVFIA